ncbi:membrane-bound metal-dependent hydrolase [Candidatus Koribacter versatilis Ellin345]|uniref:Membrane-bound metal-dependent hydrolase n=1 Tax=Koribacter versatilis (strain Ellin345) TaxID=204669 RepID=Q1ILA3_KORVE|nr:metal-dependent hydrolase [Candidatus Koribacter versatilis]ABF42347.1 membrane-bound metal-dependent hydrolase [Candidatus Koribacter versatilis Ellin345]
MSPATHLLAAGVLAGFSRLDHRGRVAVMIAGVIPDIDGLGVVPELFTRHSAHPLLWFSEFHHQLHTLLFAIIVTLVAVAFCGERLKTALFVLASFHLHLLCDLIGARGPDGDSWPIPYFAPFTQAHAWTWSGQWPLNGWQNFAITGLLLVATFWLAVRNGNSVVELFSTRADERFVGTLRGRLRSA